MERELKAQIGIAVDGRFQRRWTYEQAALA
jgi:hypothetical protein